MNDSGYAITQTCGNVHNNSLLFICVQHKKFEITQNGRKHIYFMIFGLRYPRTEPRISSLQPKYDAYYHRIEDIAPKWQAVYMSTNIS